MSAIYGITTFTDEDCWRLYLHPGIGDSVYTHLSNSPDIVRFRDASGQHVLNKQNVINQLNEALNIEFSQNKHNATQLAQEMEDIIRDTYWNIDNEDIRTVYEPA